VGADGETNGTALVLGVAKKGEVLRELGVAAREKERLGVESQANGDVRRTVGPERVDGTDAVGHRVFVLIVHRGPWGDDRCCEGGGGSKEPKGCGNT
jgi:hypothetical protein